jgi:hypothetical protein
LAATGHERHKKTATDAVAALPFSLSVCPLSQLFDSRSLNGEWQSGFFVPNLAPVQLS